MQFKRLQPKLSYSFAGCAWLFPYHLGVIDALQQHPATKRAVFLGASSGALAALVASLGLEPRAMLRETEYFAKECQGRFLGPTGRMSRYVTDGLARHLPADACERVRDRLWVSVTHWPTLRHQLVPANSCQDSKELVTLILGSCYIPLYYEKPVRWKKFWLIDGGIKNNQPSLDPFTIKVSPWRDSGQKQKRADIRPDHPLSYRETLLPDVRRLSHIFSLGQAAGHRFLKNWQRPQV